MAGVTVGYDGAPVLAEADLEIGWGQLVGVIGPNGAGKSTLIKTILGTLRAQAGTLEVGGWPDHLPRGSQPETAVPDVDAILERLDREGYRLTGPRRTVLVEVVRREGPFTSADLLAAVQAHAPTIGRATVFCTLDLLVRLGVVQRIHEDAEGGRCHAYLACDAGHHHHLSCQGCGAVTDFAEENALENLMRLVEAQTAYRIEGHRLELVGRCPACQAEAG